MLLKRFIRRLILRRKNVPVVYLSSSISSRCKVVRLFDVLFIYSILSLGQPYFVFFEILTESAAGDNTFVSFVVCKFYDVFPKA